MNFSALSLAELDKLLARVLLKLRDGKLTTEQQAWACEVIEERIFRADNTIKANQQTIHALEEFRKAAA